LCLKQIVLLLSFNSVTQQDVLYKKVVVVVVVVVVVIVIVNYFGCDNESRKQPETLTNPPINKAVQPI
jgi:hypothetical protein